MMRLGANPHHITNQKPHDSDMCACLHVLRNRKRRRAIHKLVSVQALYVQIGNKVSESSLLSTTCGG